MSYLRNLRFELVYRVMTLDEGRLIPFQGVWGILYLLSGKKKHPNDFAGGCGVAKILLFKDSKNVYA